MSTINLNPTGVFSDQYEYSPNGTTSLVTTSEGVFIPLAEIGGHLTAAEANEALVSSDYRKLLWGLLEEFYNHADGLEDQPDNMTITRTGLSFIDEDTAQRSYNVTFRLAISDMDVEGEAP